MAKDLSSIQPDKDRQEDITLTDESLDQVSGGQQHAHDDNGKHKGQNKPGDNNLQQIQVPLNPPNILPIIEQ